MSTVVDNTSSIRYPPLYNVTAYITDFPLYFNMQRFKMLLTSILATTDPVVLDSRNTAVDVCRKY